MRQCVIMERERERERIRLHRFYSYPIFFIQSVMVISISYKINVFIYEANMNIPDDGLFNYKRILILIVKRDTPNSTKKRIRHCVY